MNLNNVLHTHIDGVRCTEKFLETSQLKISFQKHHFSHIFALSQTSESGCQGVWKSKNRYVCTFGRLGCVLMMVWSWNFFLRKGMISNKYSCSREKRKKIFFWRQTINHYFSDSGSGSPKSISNNGSGSPDMNQMYSTKFRNTFGFSEIRLKM